MTLFRPSSSCLIVSHLYAFRSIRSIRSSSLLNRWCSVEEINSPKRSEHSAETWLVELAEAIVYTLSSKCSSSVKVYPSRSMWGLTAICDQLACHTREQGVGGYNYLDPRLHGPLSRLHCSKPTDKVLRWFWLVARELSQADLLHRIILRRSAAA